MDLLAPVLLPSSPLKSRRRWQISSERALLLQSLAARLSKLHVGFAHFGVLVSEIKVKILIVFNVVRVTVKQRRVLGAVHALHCLVQLVVPRPSSSGPAAQHGAQFSDGSVERCQVLGGLFRHVPNVLLFEHGLKTAVQELASVIRVELFWLPFRLLQ